LALPASGPGAAKPGMPSSLVAAAFPFFFVFCRENAERREPGGSRLVGAAGGSAEGVEFGGGGLAADAAGGGSGSLVGLPVFAGEFGVGVDGAGGGGEDRASVVI
jgi:hypothetical protein